MNLLILILKLVLVFAITLPISLLFKKRNSLIKQIVFSIAAILTVFITDYAREKLSEPIVNVGIVRTNDDYKIEVESSKPLNSIAIDLPIFGNVTGVNDLNSIADGTTTIKRIVGTNSGLSQNNIEILIEDIKPSAKLEYDVHYQSLPQGLFIAGTDRYHLSYTWQLGGDLKTKTKWIFIDTGKETVRPDVQVKGATIYHRVLTPEEIKKLYEEGIKKHELP